MMAAGATPAKRNCSATMKRCSSFEMISGGANCFSSATRKPASCSNVRSVTSGSSCLGYCARDIGQSRVPEPPERITGWIAGWLCAIEFLLAGRSSADGIVAPFSQGDMNDRALYLGNAERQKGLHHAGGDWVALQRPSDPHHGWRPVQARLHQDQS